MAENTRWTRAKEYAIEIVAPMALIGAVVGTILYSANPPKIKGENEEVTANSLPEIIKKEFKYGSASDAGLDIEVPREFYLEKRNQPRFWQSQDRAADFTNPDKFITEISDLIVKSDDSNYIAKSWREMPDYEKVLRFIKHNLSYQKDPGHGYAKYPIETLVENGGDCEDLTILAAALLKPTGRKLGLIWEPGHVTLAIGMHEGETPYTSVLKLKKDSHEKFGAYLKANPEEAKKPAEELFKDPKIFEWFDVPNTFMHEGQRYLAVEITEKNIYHVKEGIAEGGTFTPLR